MLLLKLLLTSFVILFLMCATADLLGVHASENKVFYKTYQTLCIITILLAAMFILQFIWFYGE